MHCRTRENAATYPLQRLPTAEPTLFLFSTEQRRPPTATFSTTVSFLYQSTQHFDIGLINPRSENIVQILVAIFRCLPYCHVNFISNLSFAIESASCRPQSLRLSLFHSLYHSVAKFCLTCPCQITATTNVMNHFCTRYALFACSFKYCHLLELCKTCCPLSDIHFAVVRQG